MSIVSCSIIFPNFTSFEDLPTNSTCFRSFHPVAPVLCVSCLEFEVDEGFAMQKTCSLIQNGTSGRIDRREDSSAMVPKEIEMILNPLWQGTCEKTLLSSALFLFEVTNNTYIYIYMDIDHMKGVTCFLPGALPLNSSHRWKDQRLVFCHGAFQPDT